MSKSAKFTEEHVRRLVYRGDVLRRLPAAALDALCGWARGLGARTGASRRGAPSPAQVRGEERRQRSRHPFARACPSWAPAPELFKDPSTGSVTPSGSCAGWSLFLCTSGTGIPDCPSVVEGLNGSLAPGSSSTMLSLKARMRVVKFTAVMPLSQVDSET